MSYWYCGSSHYNSLTAWAASTSVVAATIVRQLASPAVGNERAFICIGAGTTGSSEPSWVLTQGATITDASVTWQEITGKPAVNGDLTNTPLWSVYASAAVVKGTIVKRASLGSYQICTAAGTAGATEPSFSNSAGVTTTDGSVTWTSLGAPSGFNAWQAPWARLNLALGTGFYTGNGDTVYVSNNHAETQAAAIAYNANGSNTLNIVCVSDAAAPPAALANTASISTTASFGIQLGMSNFGQQYFYGVNFSAGTGSTGENLILGYIFGRTVYENCGFTLGTTAACGISLGYSAGAVAQVSTFKACRFTFGSTAQYLGSQGGDTSMAGCTFAATGSIPASLFQNMSGRVRIQDSDLSALPVINTGTTSNGIVYISLENCKLAANVTLPTGLSVVNGVFEMVNCDSAATTERVYSANGYGYLQTESSIVLSGTLATDGTTPISFKAVTNANPSRYFPYKTKDIATFNALTGASHIATVQVTTSTALTNGDVWLELEYPGSSTSPQGATVNSVVAFGAATAALSASSANWAGTAQTYKYQLSVSFTPQAAGLIRARLMVAKPSTTLWFDPIIAVA